MSKLGHRAIAMKRVTKARVVTFLLNRGLDVESSRLRQPTLLWSRLHEITSPAGTLCGPLVVVPMMTNLHTAPLQAPCPYLFGPSATTPVSQ